MSIRMILAAAAAAVLAVGAAAHAPAYAQTAPTAPPAAPSATEVADPAEAALEAKGEAFSVRMQAMGAEMQAAITAAAGDPVAAGAALDAIVAQYQPEADAFSAELKAFFDARGAVGTEEEQVGMALAAAAVVPAIQGVPAMVRGQVEQASATAAAAPAPTASE
ncbi:MAG: translation initiation factor IF-2 [Brevundimonas sp.]|uniref:translation initiation factor IF-2 n=1 Tax=Brevundimonas sp. TaxID=1871086 RepID=UPI002ABCFC7C|nr:translation initiation factor IF-2 [Brevundimonas sp.]MDZ4108983.1 translation initiation factor IF-2 [Brevundimonas sp.]